MNWLNAVAMTHANRKSRRASNAYKWHLYSLAAQLLHLHLVHVFYMDFNQVKMENKKQKTSNFGTAVVKRCFSKDTKRGIKIALDEIKKQKRFDLAWEWMAENKTGEYIKVNDIINELQTLLKNCR